MRDCSKLIETQPELCQRVQNIRLVALDVDGVLTGGEIILLPDGTDLKIFNAKDGLGIRRLIRAGIEVAFITGRKSTATANRAFELSVPHLFQNVRNKLAVAEDLLLSLNLGFENMAYMGDDLPDMPLLQAVGFSACPADAVIEVQNVCHWTSSCQGGQGAVRELADTIVYAQAALGSNPLAQDVASLKPVSLSTQLPSG